MNYKRVLTLHGKKFQFSTGFINKLIELSEGRLTSDQFEAVLTLLEAETSNFYFTPSSESNLLRIFSSIHDKIFFFQELLKYPHHIEILIAISASSNYLSDIVVRNPEYLYQVFDQDYLSKKLEYDFLNKEINESVERFKSFNAKLNFFRQIKKRFILKIGLSDILGICNLQTITEQLSYLAKSINAKLFEICYKEILLKNNLEGSKHNYCLCSLGKLGGNELNYSSDVDLILFYDFNELITQTKKEYHEILSEAAQLFIKSSSEISDHGYIYRVDFRLRPDGKYSPLCKTIVDYLQYYETRGEDWERQMLIKLEFAGGDEKLYKQFNDFVQPYTYSSSYSSSVKDKIKQMKLNIERHLTDKENVKTFSGGIRDIEFAVQALQLINGGKIKSIRAQSTLKAISLLFGNKLLRVNEKEVFTKAYIFYRRIEHFLQLMNDRQTHLIPEEDELLNKMINYLGLSTIDEFKKQLKFYRENVRNIYHEILKPGKTEIVDLTKTIKFKDPNKAASNLKFLRTGAGLINNKEFDSRTIEQFNLIEPDLIQYLKKSAVPDLVLENFTKVIRSTKYPHIWYKEFTNPKYIRNFLILCKYSQKAIDLISSDVSLEEFYLSGNVFLKEKDFATRRFSVKQNILLVAVQFALGIIREKKVSYYLLINLSPIIENVFHKFVKKNKLMIMGLGSFGWQNIDFGSDIDFIVLSESYVTSQKLLKDFLLISNQLKEIIKPFEIDFKLRPEGKSSQLIWDLEHYDEYLRKRARMWEYQSLLKQSAGIGEPNLLNRYRKIIAQCFDMYNKSNLQADVLKMYNSILKQTAQTSDGSFNIKKDKGGLITLDFILQYVVLTEKSPYKIDFRLPYVFTYLKDKIQANDISTIQKNFMFLKRVLAANQNIFNTNSSIIPSNIEKGLLLSSFLKFKKVDDFNKKISEIIKTNNILFEKYVGK